MVRDGVTAEETREYENLIRERSRLMTPERRR